MTACDFSDAFSPPLATMRLRWPDAAARRSWRLPGRVTLPGPPQRFGVRVLRRGLDCYAVFLLWDHHAFEWPALTRQDLLPSSLADLLHSLHTDLQYLLDQPVDPAPVHIRLVRDSA